MPGHMTYNDVGVYLHTALRKHCDSHPTSALYNAIHLSSGGWNALVDELHGRLDNFKREEVKQQLQLILAEPYFPWLDDDQKRSTTLYTELLLFYNLSSMMDEYDWDCMVSFFEEG